jgi:hypothetical protein
MLEFGQDELGAKGSGNPVFRLHLVDERYRISRNFPFSGVVPVFRRCSRDTREMIRN